MADTKKKLVGAAALTFALAGGGMVGAVLGVPGVSGAQEGTVEPADEPAGPGDERRVRHRFAGPPVEAAAEALGMSVEELHTELESGRTIADVAGEQGVELDTVIDAMVAAATEDILEHMAALANGELPPPGPHHGRGGPGGHHQRGFRVALAVVAETIGIEEQALRDALDDGQSIAEVAEANRVEVQTVIDALVADASARLDEAVADGRISEQRAAELKEELPERVDHVVTSGSRFHRRR